MKVQPCVGCGHCCITAKCGAAQRLYPAADRCPKLRWDEGEGRYFCELMELPGEVGLAYRKELYAGEGCCQNLNSWRLDVKRRDPEEAKLPTLDRTFQIFLHCLGREWISSDVYLLTLAAFTDEIEELGHTRQEAEGVARQIMFCLQNNRRSYLKEFMG